MPVAECAKAKGGARISPIANSRKQRAYGMSDILSYKTSVKLSQWDLGVKHALFL
jgi:hypothetical protein